MKIKLTILCSAMLLAAAVLAQAGEIKSAGSPEFERMKSLVGSWTGKVDMGQGLVDMTAEYRLIAGGSVLEEKVFGGTPQEMLTMFYDKGGKISATHYCLFGNRPQFFFKSSDAKSISFDFDKTCGIDASKEAHMHSLKIVFNDTDTITTSCQAFMAGKEIPAHDTVLRRVK